VLNGPEGTTPACDGGDDGGGDDDQLLSIELNSRMLSSGRNSTAKQKAIYKQKKAPKRRTYSKSIRRIVFFARNQ